MSNDIEQEIQAKGLTAPRVTPQQIEETIVGEYFFTANDGVLASAFHRDCTNIHCVLGRLTFCVLVLKNGFAVTGESACVSEANFDAEIGRKIARQNAVQKIWALEGYALANAIMTLRRPYDEAKSR
jgi:hypothetical protein